MTAADLVALRLRNQKLPRTTFRRPEEVVAWLGAVQSQDYIGAKWGLGLRANGLTDAAADRAFNEGRILRTHVLRPTWHFVAPADIRWMLALTAPRVHQFNGYMYRLVECDAKVFSRCHAIVTRALEGGKHLTRTELQTALREKGVESNSLRLGALVMHAELSAVICSGPLRGKQHTYALLEDRVPPVAALSRDEALAALSQRYFASHGPATVRDYAWWSGLSMRDAKRGVEMIAPASGSELEEAEVGDCTYRWYPARAGRGAAARTPTAWLMPNFDEYFIAYKDRESVLRGGPAAPSPIRDAARPEFAHLLSIDGWLTGSWKRTTSAKTADIEVRSFRPLKRNERAALDAVADRYRAFMGLPGTLTVS